MPNNRSNPVEKYHDLLSQRLKAWLDHVETSRATYSKILGNVGSKDYSFRQATGDVTNLWLSWYDTAFGWMWPQVPSSSTSETAQAETKSTPRRPRAGK